MSETKNAVQDLNAIFKDEVQAASSGGRNQLNATAALTALSTRVAHDMLNKINANIADYKDALVGSQKSHDAMDDLIGGLCNIGELDMDFLPDATDKKEAEELEKMLRSQQSKRSRAKSKHMTRENYTNMLIGAIAENIIRFRMGKPKSAGGSAALGDLGISDEDYQKLAEDEEELKKAIRNVQSKKSIMKSKQGFSENDTRWVQLLALEDQLKTLRDNKTHAVSEEAKHALEVKNEAETLLAEVDTDDLSAEQAKELLDKMKEMLASR